MRQARFALQGGDRNGQLAVARADAVAVRAYARANPSLGIVEQRNPRASRTPKVPEGDA